MPLPIISTVALIALVATAIYKVLIYPIFVSPLAKIPAAHWSSPFSSLWILYYRQQQQDTLIVHAAHLRLGPVIRLAPNELSVNCVDGGIRTIYSGGFEKGDWYSNVFMNYGVRPMFAMEAHGAHAVRKRMVSNVYAKSTLLASDAVERISDVLVRNRLVGRLSAASKDGKGVVEMYDLLAAVLMDFVSAYVFGLRSGSDFLTKEAEAKKFAREYKARQIFTFWPQELPTFTRFMGSLGLRGLLVPSWVDDSNASIERWLIGMCDGAEETLQAAKESGQAESLAVGDYPTVYAQLRNTLRKEVPTSATSKHSLLAPSDPTLRLKVASELLDHTLAGFDTSSITLVWLAWQLSRPPNTHWQTALHAELAPLGPRPSAKTLDAQPLLHAIIMETLRLHTAIPGNQPRVTPVGALTAFGHVSTGKVYAGIPSGIRVQSQAYTLHRNPHVFPNPETWNPSRWLEDGPSSPEQRKEMLRWFWAFGSGGRMCVGSNLAMLDMKAVVAGIWANFATEIVDDEGMVANGGYIAEPLGVEKNGFEQERRFLRLRIKERSGSKF